MDLVIPDSRFLYETENICRLFFGQLTVHTGRARQAKQYGEYIYMRASSREGGRLFCAGTVYGESFRYIDRQYRDPTKSSTEQQLCRLLYDALTAVTSMRPPWGILIGVRPAAFTRKLLDSCGSESKVMEQLTECFRVSQSKARLAVEVAGRARPVIALSDSSSFSLYISIPFCPSRCSYCSFVSRTLERDSALMDIYLARLCSDLCRVAETAKQLKLRLMSVYIGGGTPGMLSAIQTQRLLHCMNEQFEDIPECTFEAGRPDTIQEDKLAVLCSCGVKRISINPQTKQDELLRSIGRNHTARDTERAFELAAKAGLHDINADLIAGLPGDTQESFQQSVQWLLNLDPGHITVHALTLKRSSALREGGEGWNPQTSCMIQSADSLLRAAGYLPYYLYRQKGTAQGLENVGYAKQDHICRYNIFMMDEVHTVAGIGAGAVTKLVDKDAGRILRLNNLKYPAEYLAEQDRIDIIVKGITDFYNKPISKGEA